MYLKHGPFEFCKALRIKTKTKKVVSLKKMIVLSEQRWLGHIVQNCTTIVVKYLATLFYVFIVKHAMFLLAWFLMVNIKLYHL